MYVHIICMHGRILTHLRKKCRSKFSIYSGLLYTCMSVTLVVTCTCSESLQGLGFTVILDMRQSSWAVMKKALKSLQLTFVEHVHRVLLIKPRAFWQRQRAGVNFTLKKAKFNYPVSSLAIALFPGPSKLVSLIKI